MQEKTIVTIAPADDLVVRHLADEANKILRYAQARIIRTNDDLIPATDDVSTIAKLLKALKAKKEEYVRPIKNHLDAVSAAFGTFMHPLEEADVITRDQIKAFRAEVDRQRREAEDIDRQKMELARREAELHNGEITVDLAPVAKPEAAPDKVHTAVGSASTMKVRKYRIVDFAKLNDKYKVENAALLNRLTKAGIPEIEGVEFYWEETLRVNLK